VGERPCAAFRRGVVGLAEIADDAGGGGGVDDDPAAAVFLHPGENRPSHGKHALQIDLDDGVPVAFLHLQQSLVPQNAGVVDQDVDTAEIVEGALQLTPAAFHGCDVLRVCYRPATCVADGGDRK